MTNPSDGLVNDRRRPPFCYQTLDALAAIRSYYREKNPNLLSTALGIYLTLTEHANRNGGAAARGGFKAYRTEIAQDAGVSTDTLDRYVRDLEEVGVLAVERHQEGRVSLPNTWALHDPPGRTDAAGVAAPMRPNARAFLLSEKNEPQERTPVVPSNRPAEVNGRAVTDEEYGLAAQVLAAFNEQFGSRYTQKVWIEKIIRRIREQPELGLADHAAVIQTAARNPWWSGPASPSIVYGNPGQFERSVHAVLALAQESAADRVAALGQGPDA